MNSRKSVEKGQVLVEAHQLGKDFLTAQGVISPLKAIDLTVLPGEMLGIMGPSGAGKSTLLFILGLLLDPTRGTYRLGGHDVANLGRRDQARLRRDWIGFVFQSADLVEGSSVYENVELPLIYSGLDRSSRRDRIQEALERVRMAGRMRDPANLLSGGERQRVVVARALVNRPRLILADEPTGQLDEGNGRVILDHFGEVACDGRTAVLLVTHDRNVAERCSRICRLVDGVLHDD